MAGMPFLRWHWAQCARDDFRGSDRAAGGGIVFRHPCSAVCRKCEWVWPKEAGALPGIRGDAFGSKLVVVELATAMVLLVGAGLLGKSLLRLLQVDLGFRPEKLITLQFSVPRKSYANPDKADALERQIVSSIRSLPGVQSVGVAGQLPVSGYGSNTTIHIVGRPWSGTEDNSTPQRDVDPAYFTALGARLVRGRYFNDTDASKKPDPTIVNQAFARQYFPGGKRGRAAVRL